MKHSMKLLENPFERVKLGKKTIEIRLFDEKRAGLNLGDIIEFYKLPELKYKLEVEVVGLLKYNSFKDLVNDFGMSFYGYPSDYPLEDFLRSIYEIYSPEEEKKLGVLGIKIKLLK